jgi:ATP dependent DNA ligase C terminal region
VPRHEVLDGLLHQGFRFACGLREERLELIGGRRRSRRSRDDPFDGPGRVRCRYPRCPARPGRGPASPRDDRAHPGAVTPTAVLVYVGDVGTGFTDAARRRLLELLRPLHRDEPPFAAAFVRARGWVGRPPDRGPFIGWSHSWSGRSSTGRSRGQLPPSFVAGDTPGSRSPRGCTHPSRGQPSRGHPRRRQSEPIGDGPVAPSPKVGTSPQADRQIDLHGVFGGIRIAVTMAVITGPRILRLPPPSHVDGA